MSKTDTSCSAKNIAYVFNKDRHSLENNMDLLAYRKMYTIMFNAVTDAMGKLQDAEVILCKAQQHCEQTFIEADETLSFSCSKSAE